MKAEPMKSFLLHRPSQNEPWCPEEHSDALGTKEAEQLPMSKRNESARVSHSIRLRSSGASDQIWVDRTFEALGRWVAVTSLSMVTMELCFYLGV